MMRFFAIAIAILGAAGAVASAESRTAADAAFARGRELAQAGRYAEACPQFELSQQLDPAIGTLLNLADCHIQIGRIASASAEFKEAADRAHRAGQREREQEAMRRAKAIEPRLMRLEVSVPRDAAVLSVFRGSTDITRLLGLPIPVDPGVYRLVARWRSGQATSASVEVRGEGRTVTKLLAPPAEDAGHPGVPVPARMPSEPSAGGLDRRDVFALSAAGVGVVSLGTALLFGRAADRKLDQSRSFCDANNACTERGVALVESAQKRATLANVFGAVAVVGLAGGAILWLTAPSADEADPTARVADSPRLQLAPTLGAEAAGVVLHGRF